MRFYVLILLFVSLLSASAQEDNTAKGDVSKSKGCGHCQGSLTLCGMPGTPGSNGIPGMPGVPGLPGRDGVALVSGKLDPRDVKGSKGEAGKEGKSGANGTKGEKGDAGDYGPQGSKGVAGIPGKLGPMGVKGSRGEDGEKGKSGSNGKNGEKGNTGDYGPQGSQGVAGVSGKLGPRGVKGSKGEAGEEGKIGANGRKGEKGDAEITDPTQRVNWKQCVWKADSSTDSGKIRECSFNKLHQSSALRVSYQGNIRVLGTYRCNRWFFKFNGSECSGPMTIEAVVYNYWPSTIKGQPYLPHHRSFEGYCENLGRGTVSVELWVGKCPGETLGDAYTGWKSVSRIMIEEVPPSQ